MRKLKLILDPIITLLGKKADKKDVYVKDDVYTKTESDLKYVSDFMINGQSHFKDGLVNIFVETEVVKGSENPVTSNAVATYAPKTVYLTDLSDGFKYALSVDNGTLVTSNYSLTDFEYTIEDDGTYTLTGWKKTLEGKPSTECIIPDNAKINL